MKIKMLIKMIIPDAIYLEYISLKVMHRFLNIRKPKTYNEKLQWLKLHDRNPKYTKMVDKYEAKKIVADIIGEEYIIPTLGVWDTVDEIDLDVLPNSFVLKTTHDSGGVVVCKDKSTFDFDAAKRKLDNNLHTNFYYISREWPYKNVTPRIIAEQYLEDEIDPDLKDYKVYTFNGVAKLVFVASERGKGTTKADYFDKDFNKLDFSWGYPHAKVCPNKPVNFEKMIEFAEKLSEDTYTLRVDFYEVNGKLYFGELTLYDGSGFAKFEPEEWDSILGSWVKLPSEDF